MCRMLKVTIFCLCLINVIGSNDHLWHSYKFGTGHGNREEFTVSKVTADENFKSAQGVRKWKSVTGGGRAFAVGLMENGVTVVSATLDDGQKKLRTKSWDVGFNSTPTDALCFFHWNSENRKKEFVMAIASNENNQASLTWMKFSEKNTLENFWKWNLNKMVSYIDTFQIDDKYLLLVSGNTTVDLYQFELEPKKDFWLTQIIQLSDPIESSALNTFGQFYYLSLPQTSLNIVKIFQYENGRFKAYKNITSDYVDHVSAFKIGFNSYLAISGGNAGIFRFAKTSLIREVIKDFNEDEMDFWYPIHVKTYRDEVILLAQTNLYHGTHEAAHVAVVTFDGKNFVLHEEVPCNFFGDEVNGLDLCVPGEESESGIIGLTELSLRNFTSVLVPMKNAPSRLFMFETVYKNNKDPVDVEVEKLKEAKLLLERMMQNNMDAQNEIDAKLRNAVKVDTQNNIQAPWKVNTLAAAALRQNQPITWTSAEGLEVEEVDFVTMRTTIDVIWEKLKDIKTKVDKMENSIGEGGRFNVLHIEGTVEVHGDSSFNETIIERINDEEWNDTVKDIVRLDNLMPITAAKTFTDLEVDNLFASTLNGIKSQNLVFSDEEHVVIKGDMIFLNVINVSGNAFVSSGKINDVILKDEIVVMNELFKDNLRFEQIEIADALEVKIINNQPIHSEHFDVTKNSELETVDSLMFDFIDISSQITAVNVNGENFDEFVDSLCFTNIKTYIPGTTRLQTLRVENATTNYLNELKFPDEYVFKQFNSFSNITGKKTFAKKVFANELIIRELINGKHPDGIVTLTNNQSLPRNFTFDNLEITESLDFDGNITGKYVDNFLPNPTLIDTNYIKSNLNFQSLEVVGSVIISGYFDGIQFDIALDNILIKDKPNQVINSVKEFPNGFTISNGLNLQSNSINSILLDAFITKNTEQIIATKTLNGAVGFENLFLGGLFGNVNVTELEDTTVKLNGEQFISSTLIFENDLVADNLEITESLNNLPLEYYYFRDGDRKFDEFVEFESIHVERVNVGGNLTGNIVDFDVDDFDRRRLSFTKNQVVTANYTIKDLQTKDLEVDFVNGYPFDNFFGLDTYHQKVVKMLQDGRFKINDLYINGSLYLKAFNGINMDTVFKDMAWKDRENNFTDDVIIEGDVYFESLNLDVINDLDFGRFVENVVFKNETSVSLKGLKTYKRGFHVNKYADIRKLNDIPVENVLRKTTNKRVQEISGPIHIVGDVTVVDDSEINYTLNEVSIENLAKTFYTTEDGYKIKGDVTFTRELDLENLVVEGLINNVDAINALKNIVYHNKDADITGTIVFKNLVHIEHNLGVANTVNDVDLSEFHANAVSLVADSNIDGTVVFKRPVNITNIILFEDDITTRYLLGIDLLNWKNNAVFINKGLIPGNLTFEKVFIKDDIQTENFNGINTNNLIPLHTDQSIDGKINISTLQVVKDVEVRNLVNNFVLLEEYENTVLNGYDQEITSNINFAGNVVVRDNLNAFGKINGHDMATIVTTNTDQKLRGSFVFHELVTFYSDLEIHGHINGINVTHWMNKGLNLYSPYDQNVVGKWSVNGNITFDGNIIGSGTLGGVDVAKMAARVEKRKNFLYSAEKQLIEDFTSACQDVNYILSAARNQIYIFKHFEISDRINFNEEIQKVHNFKVEDNNFLLVNTKKTCQSHLYIWTQTKFLFINSFETGSIEQIITVKDGLSAFLVTKSNTFQCPVGGTNVWKFSDNYLMPLQNIEDVLLLQDSLVPATFYTLYNENVVEYRLVTDFEISARKIRQWRVAEENLAFVPRGLHTGLALRNGNKMFRLLRENTDDPVVANDFGHETDVSIVGDVMEEYHNYLPGSYGNEILVMNVGAKNRRKILTAVASHEKTSIKRKLDLIKIYENIMSGIIFHNIPTYKPSSLLSLEFPESGETLLMFLEDEKILQIYEYKGIEGFKHRSSANMEGTHLFTMALPLRDSHIGTNFVGLVNKNSLSIFEAVMCGNRIKEEDMQCET